MAAQNLFVKLGVKDSILVWTVFTSGRYGSVEIFQDRGHIFSIGRTGADADLGGADTVKLPYLSLIHI